MLKGKRMIIYALKSVKRKIRYVIQLRIPKLSIEEDTKVIKGQITGENHTRIFTKDIKLILMEKKCTMTSVISNKNSMKGTLFVRSKLIVIILTILFSTSTFFLISLRLDFRKNVLFCDAHAHAAMGRLPMSK